MAFSCRQDSNCGPLSMDGWSGYAIILVTTEQILAVAKIASLVPDVVSFGFNLVETRSFGVWNNGSELGFR